jgi:hypothetical protein
MHMSLALCRQFNSSHNVDKYKLDERPILAKLKLLSKESYKKSKEDDFKEAKQKFSLALSLQKEVSKRETAELISQFQDTCQSILNLIKSRIKLDLQEMQTGICILQIWLKTNWMLGFATFKYKNDLLNSRMHLVDFAIVSKTLS